MKRKFLSIFVVALFAFSAFVIMDADDSDAYEYGMWFNNHPVDGTTSTYLESEHWEYVGTEKTGTLTLNGATLENCKEFADVPCSPISFIPSVTQPPGMIIELHGDNYINVTTNDSKDEWAGIYAACNLTLTGDGTLTITVADSHNKLVYGMFVGGLEIDGQNGLTFNISIPDGGTFDPMYYDFNCDILCDQYPLNMNGGTINASRLIYAENNIAISAGEICFSGKRSDTAYNIYSCADFDLSGSGLASFDYDLAANDNMICAEGEIQTHDAIMSDNLEVSGNDIKATAAGHGWIGFKSSTITFDGNGGTPSAASSVTSTVGKLAELPDATYEEHIFQGWFTEIEGGTEITTSTVFKSNMTVYAHWIMDPNIKTVTFDANGGSCSTSTAKTGADKKLVTLPDATRDGYTFDGWYTAADGGDKISTSTVFDSDITIYAHWTESGGGGGTEGGSGGINWNPDFDRLTDRDLRLVILLTAVTVLSLLIMGGYIFGKKN